jgi:hypothetical protein
MKYSTGNPAETPFSTSFIVKIIYIEEFHS